MSSANRILENNIEKLELIEWKRIQKLQGNLKELTVLNLKKLKKSIIDHNFSAPFFVWENKKSIYSLDGVQRKLALYELISDGYEVPEKLPAVFIKAKNRKNAIRLLLSITSNYGKITDQGLYELIETENLEFDELKEDIELGDIDFDRFEKEFYNDNTPDIEPEIEFTEELYERHNYILLYFDNEIDWNTAIEKLNIKTKKALDGKPGYNRTGIGRVYRE